MGPRGPTGAVLVAEVVERNTSLTCLDLVKGPWVSIGPVVEPGPCPGQRDMACTRSLLSPRLTIDEDTPVLMEEPFARSG